MNKIYNENVTIYNLDKDNLEIFNVYYDSNWNIDIIDNPSIDSLDNCYKIEFNTNYKDSYYIVRWNDLIEVIKNGYPIPLLLVSFPYKNKLSVAQILEDETIESNLNYLDYGIYYYEPKKINKSVFIISQLNMLLNVNYNLSSCDFSKFRNIDLQIGKNQFVLLPFKNSKFNIEKGLWEYSKEPVKISDVANAIAYMNDYNIDVIKIGKLPENHIRNYIKYFRWYNVITKRYYYYIPGFTNLNNINNIELYENDRIRNIEILSLKDLEVTISGKVEKIK